MVESVDRVAVRAQVRPDMPVATGVFADAVGDDDDRLRIPVRQPGSPEDLDVVCAGEGALGSGEHGLGHEAGSITVASPFSPSTRITSPVRIADVPLRVPITQGIPSSR